MDNNNTQPMHLPPHSVETECAVLGAMLLEGNAFMRVPFLTPEMFTDARNRKVFNIIASLASDGQDINLVSVHNRLLADKSSVGVDSAYIAELMMPVSTSVCIVQHALYLKSLYQRRQLITLGAELTSMAYDLSEDVEGITDTHLSKLCLLTDGLSDSDITMHDAKGLMMDRIKKAYLGEELGVPTGFHEIDQQAGGFSRGDLIIIGADTSVGKSALAWTIAVNAAATGAPIGFISLEMSPAQLFGRAVARKTAICSGRITNPAAHGDRRLSDIEVGMVERASDTVEQLPIFIADIRTVEGICAKVKMWVMKHGIRGVFIDYLQILATAGSNTNETTFLTNAARRFQQLAKEQNIFVCLLSQFSRPTSGESNGASLRRLRGSQEIASAADMVILVSRPEQDGSVYPKPFENISTRGTALVDIRKGRNVGTMKFVVAFDSITTTFRSIEGTPPLAKDDPIYTAPLITYNDAFS